MKNLILSLLLLTFLGAPVYAHTDNEDLSADEIVDRIVLEQGVSSVEDIDCDQIPDKELEELGDAVMSVMHPDTNQHEAMDNMMGGEGSDSLTTMHITMGKNYLGCTLSSADLDVEYNPMPMMGYSNWGSNAAYQPNTVLIGFLIGAVTTIVIIGGTYLIVQSSGSNEKKK